MKLNKKRNWILSILSIFGFVAIQCMEAPERTDVRSVRVIPMAFNEKNNKWSVLLGLNAKPDRSGNKFWSDFFQLKNTDEINEKFAQKILKTQTNSLYDINILKKSINQEIPSRTTRDNDIVFFVPVNYISGRDLFSKGQNQIKNDFAWIEADKLIGTQQLSLPHYKQQIPVSRGVLALLSNLLPEIIGQLNDIMLISGTSRQTPSEKPKFIEEEEKPKFKTKERGYPGEQVKFTQEMKKSYLFASREKGRFRYIPTEYRGLDDRKKASIISILPANLLKLLETTLEDKLRNTGFAPEEQRKVIKQFIIEEVLHQMSFRENLDVNKFLSEIKKLEPCDSSERKRFMAEVDRDRYDSSTAFGKIICSDGFMQWD